MVLKEKNWLAEILIAQINDYKPDIVFLDDHTLLSINELKQLKKDCKSIRLVISWCGAPFTRSVFFSEHDLVLSCIPEIVDQLRNLGGKSEHLHHAFSPRILDNLEPTAEPPIKFSFIGQIARGNHQHLRRGNLLKRLVSNNIPLEIYTPSYEWSVREKMKSYLKHHIGSAYPILKLLKREKGNSASNSFINKCNLWNEQLGPSAYAELLPHMQQPVFGLEMFKILKRSQISLNCHIDASKNSASNMRLFEATGMGSCLLTDSKSNLSQLFEPDYEVATYRSPEECIEKANWLMNNPEKRIEIAKAGQKRTLQDHTFEKRAIEFINTIQPYLK
ncbi:MAG: glycosyltransferase [Cyanobacteria bacterium J06649_11]